MKYCIYETKNLINNKVYVGFHSVKNENEILSIESESESIFNDGYLGSGVLIKKAIKKYGENNFKQRLIKIFDDKKEAELLESFIVDLDFVNRKNTYNISLGGNVAILYKENNGFYGKKHNMETKKQILQTRIDNDNLNNSHYFLTDGENVYKNRSEVMEKYNVSLIGLGKLLIENVVWYIKKNVNDNAIRRYKKYFDNQLSEEELIKYYEKLAEKMRELGKRPKSEEQKQKISESNKKWIKNNPELHKKRMDKINKNPEKIRKTAEKHTGMKRSEETCRKISESLKGNVAPNKNMVAIFNTETNEIKYIEKGIEINNPWVFGMKNSDEIKHRGFAIHHPETLEIKLIQNVDDKPNDWDFGRKPRAIKKTKEDVLKNYEKYIAKIKRRKLKNET